MPRLGYALQKDYANAMPGRLDTNLMPPADTLLSQGDPPPVRVHAADASSPLLIVCDHAGRCVPARLGDLGVAPVDWDRHIAWDIGAAGVCAALAPLLGVCWIEQVYSRLVIDCNRQPGHPTSIAPESDSTPIPGNHDLSEEAKALRLREIFNPYHGAIAAALDRLEAQGAAPIVIAMHSFTPEMAGFRRPWEAGVLFNRNPALSLVLAGLLREAGLTVGENEPYALADDSDYTVPVHAEARGLDYVELEIRQDLIASEQGQLRWAELLAGALPRALRMTGRGG